MLKLELPKIFIWSATGIAFPLLLNAVWGPAGVLFGTAIVINDIKKHLSVNNPKLKFIKSEVPQDLKTNLDELSVAAGVESPQLLYGEFDNPVIRRAYYANMGATKNKVFIDKNFSHIKNKRIAKFLLAHELSHIINNDDYVMVPVGMVEGLLRINAFFAWGMTVFNDASPLKTLAISICSVGFSCLIAGLHQHIEYRSDREACDLVNDNKGLIDYFAAQQLLDTSNNARKSKLQKLFQKVEVVIKRGMASLLVADHPSLAKRALVLHKLKYEI